MKRGPACSAWRHAQKPDRQRCRSQFNEARWATLEAALGSDIAAWFMWMHEIRLDDGTRIDAYKHTTTRRYLHLSDDGRAFDYLGDGGYGEVDSQLRSFADSAAGNVPYRRRPTCKPCGRPSRQHAAMPLS